MHGKVMEMGIVKNTKLTRRWRLIYRHPELRKLKMVSKCSREMF